MLQRLASAFRRLNRTVEGELLVVTDAGLELRDRRHAHPIWTMGWKALEEVVAFKRDMVTVDDLCLGFRSRGESQFYVCDEETPGWDQVNDALTARYGIQYQAWVAEIMKPPFVENWTVLWRRDAAEQAHEADVRPGISAE